MGSWWRRTEVVGDAGGSGKDGVKDGGGDGR